MACDKRTPPTILVVDWVFLTSGNPAPFTPDLPQIPLVDQTHDCHVESKTIFVRTCSGWCRWVPGLPIKVLLIEDLLLRVCTPGGGHSWFYADTLSQVEQVMCSRRESWVEGVK